MASAAYIWYQDAQDQQYYRFNDDKHHPRFFLPDSSQRPKHLRYHLKSADSGQHQDGEEGYQHTYHHYQRRYDAF